MPGLHFYQLGALPADGNICGRLNGVLRNRNPSYKANPDRVIRSLTARSPLFHRKPVPKAVEMSCASLKSKSGARVWQVDIMALLFGIGAWISVNGMWVQLPLLVQMLPEGWNLPSYMSVIIQVANIGPILYSILRMTVPSRVEENYCIYVVMAVGTISSLFMVFFWMQTTNFDGEERSIALLVLLFFLSLVDCSSSVLFMPFMGELWRQNWCLYDLG